LQLLIFLEVVHHLVFQRNTTFWRVSVFPFPGERMRRCRLSLVRYEMLISGPGFGINSVCWTHCVGAFSPYHLKTNRSTLDYWGSELCPSSSFFFFFTGKNVTFQKLDLFCPQVRRQKTATLLVPLERANLSHWTAYVSVTTAMYVLQIKICQWE
jgi:hypothetical protein